MTDKKYEAARNKLIPFAEKYANEMEGKNPRPGQSREEWVKAWNLSFLGKMDSLAKEQGLKGGHKMAGIDALRGQVRTQCSNGNWNYDPYMHGMANGLICALAIVEGKEPRYLNPPETWLCDHKIDNDEI